MIKRRIEIKMERRTKKKMTVDLRTEHEIARTLFVV